MSSLLRFVLFADDTNIFLSGDDAKEISNTLSIELDKLNSWFAVHKLSLNVSKTNYMIFGNKKIDKDMNIRVGINGISIDRVYKSSFQQILMVFMATMISSQCGNSITQPYLIVLKTVAVIKLTVISLTPTSPLTMV